MFKEKFNPFDKSEGGQEVPKQEKPESVFATEEELAEKKELLKQLEKAHKDMSEKGLRKQKDILFQMDHLVRKRERRMKGVPFEELPEQIKESLQKDIENFQEIYDLNNIKKKVEALPLLKEELEKIKKLREKDPHLELHYLPEFEITKDTKFPKDFSEFSPKMFEWLKKGRIRPESLKIEESYVLIDSRSSPEYDEGTRELYENDETLEKLIKELRENEEIEQYEKGLVQSRNNASHQEIKKKILPQYSKELNLEESKVRLPKYSELYLIGNLYHRQWREADIHEWTDDKYNSHLVHSRPGLSGALYTCVHSDANWDNLDSHAENRVFRPVVDLTRPWNYFMRE